MLLTSQMASTVTLITVGHSKSKDEPCINRLSDQRRTRGKKSMSLLLLLP